MFFYQRLTLADHTPDRKFFPGCRHGLTGLGQLGVKRGDLVAIFVGLPIPSTPSPFGPVYVDLRTANTPEAELSFDVDLRTAPADRLNAADPR